MKIETMQTIYMPWEDLSKALQFYLQHAMNCPDLARKVETHGIDVDTNSEGLIIMIDGSECEMLSAQANTTNQEHDNA